ncbi:hypothetical protein CRU98_13225 [Arcobacter sp. CECT 8986]|uniref:hypothetical protein n=1 Tax=Arcobacter sp. CECT 8986 TaxID=2044507 RepID=UPI001009DF64|nr:hypothetical protein [Arcobacter sp. CECT 8986]RXJ97589.1 hypothetical protein CRU98_13225 [Arcobacter sp. CECT 8986]
MKKLTSIVLLALWDSNGYKTHKQVKETLINKVFKNIEEEHFEKYIEHFRTWIDNTHPQNEKDLFEEALNEFKEG